MDDDELLEAFDRQVRRAATAPAGFRVDVVDDPAPHLRLTAVNPEAGWGGGVFWCDLDETNADAAIAAAIAWFQDKVDEFEWKYYAYDRPADLPDRLRAAGLEPDDDEALVVGEVAVVRERLAAAVDPPGITVRRLHGDPAGAARDWQGMNDLQQAVWGHDAAAQNASIAAELAADPTGTSVWVAVADDGADGERVVCAARANFHHGTDFASLWGGSTLEAYRGRGIYKALVARRAEEAADRGFRYLQVDASPDSRPILQRLGLRPLTSTTPWVWRRAGRDRPAST
ncbi:MAG: hypothetical protein QOE01_2730 [Actinomycetota bacterium]|nr:hypothetical protein [Actinomycetota bacterium]